MTVDDLIDALTRLQIEEGHPYAAPGLFASYRKHYRIPYHRPDDNIFFPAVIDYTLNGLKEALNAAQRTKIRKIQRGIRANYPAYAARRDARLYHFYRTDPPGYFPNGRLLHRIPRYQFAEDADDTIIISANNEGINQETCDFLRAELLRFSNHSGRALHLLPGYAELPAYATWFGSGAMPVMLDFGVLCNILCFGARRGWPLEAADLASLEYLRRALVSNHVFTHPYALSPYYPHPLVLLYHLGRLHRAMPALADYLPYDTIRIALARTEGTDQGLLANLLRETARLKMGFAPRTRLEFTEADLVGATEELAYFSVSVIGASRNRWLDFVARYRTFRIDFHCTAYPLAIALEYKTLRAAYEAERG